MPYMYDEAVEAFNMEGLAMHRARWEYSMRREMQEIVAGVFLGPYASASKKAYDNLKAAGITHIVCIRHSKEAPIVKPNFPNDFSYLVVEVADTPQENIIQHLEAFKQFCVNALRSGGKVLVHGNAGISRSAALMVAFVMETHNVDLEQAFHLVQSRRFCVCPNEGFMAQLSEYASIYRARAMVAGQEAMMEQAHARGNARKRTSTFNEYDEGLDRPAQPEYIAPDNGMQM